MTVALADSPLVTEGVPTMPPGMKIERMFDVTTMWPGGDPPVRRYDVEVVYADEGGKPQQPLRYPIDFGPFLSGTFTARKSSHDGIKALMEIEKVLKAWTESRGIRVWTRDGAEKDKQDRERTERRARPAGESPPRASGD